MKVNIRKLSVLSAIIVTPLLFSTENSDYLIEHVKKSIENAYAGISQLNGSILNVQGFSGYKIKHLLNNVCSLPGARYLEIGVYRGSTFVAALYGNTSTLADAIAIDNWAEFGNNKSIFTNTTSQYLPQDSFRFYEQDSFKINLSQTFNEPITIYFYDGHHSPESQAKAFTYFNSILADTFIAIIDDWSWVEVHSGTRKAFDELGYKIIFERALGYGIQNDRENWWNGTYIAVISKN